MAWVCHRFCGSDLDGSEPQISSARFFGAFLGHAKMGLYHSRLETGKIGEDEDMRLLYNRKQG